MVSKWSNLRKARPNYLNRYIVQYASSACLSTKFPGWFLNTPSLRKE